MTRGFWKKIRAIVSLGASAAFVPLTMGAEKPAEQVAEESAVAASEARSLYFKQTIGDLPPNNRLRLVNLQGIWDAGALYTIEAGRLGEHVVAYSTFGLSDSDMPARLGVEEPDATLDDLGRPSGIGASMPRFERQRAIAPSGAAGYGYELIVLTREKASWPLHVLHWAVSAEVFRDLGLLARVQSHGAFTARGLHVGPGADDTVCVLVAKPLPPLPCGTQLPNGRLQLLVATVITQQEHAWANRHGAMALLDKLTQAGHGQMSQRHRRSVIT